MYDVMIIDDDDALRQHLKSLINWDALPIHFSCEARDSETAKELFLQYNPMIVLTDINIPIISGLDLIKELSAINSNTQFIVITGYTDFEYAQKAVALGAVELLSKPLSSQAVNAALRKTVDRFEKIRQARTSTEALRKLISDYLPTLREKFMSHLLSPSAHFSASELSNRMSLLNIDIRSTWYTLAILSTDCSDESTINQNIHLVSFKNICDELICNAGFKVFSFYDDYYRLNCLIGWSVSDGELLLEQCINRIVETERFLHAANTFVGVGSVTTILSQLPHVARHAMTAYSSHKLLGEDTVVFYKDVKTVVVETAPFNDEQAIHQIRQEFCANNMVALQKELKDAFRALAVEPREPMLAAQNFCFTCLSNLISETVSMGINISEFPDLITDLNSIVSIKSFSVLQKSTLSFITRLNQHIVNRRTRNQNQLIEDAKRFILSNLSDEAISLDTVSNQIGLSSIYFCKLFHKTVGISFNDYLNRERIKAAQNLLEKTDMKIYEVSCKTGYTNPKYFYYVFKRITGMTPLEFRKSKTTIMDN